MEAIRLTSPEVARFSGTDSLSDDESSAWTSRTYEFVSQNYGSRKNLEGDAGENVVAVKASFLSVWSGKGGRECCCGNCGKCRERLGSRIILRRWGERGGVT